MATNTTELIEKALKKYPKAKRLAVENFCWSAPEDSIANRGNLRDDARSYRWNADTVNAIHSVLKTEGKI